MSEGEIRSKSYSSQNENVVHNLVYFNYAKANKLKVKASKKIKKLLGNLDDNIKVASKFDGPKTQH